MYTNSQAWRLIKKSGKIMNDTYCHCQEYRCAEKICYRCKCFKRIKKYRDRGFKIENVGEIEKLISPKSKLFNELTAHA